MQVHFQPKQVIFLPQRLIRSPKWAGVWGWSPDTRFDVETEQ